jgi:hypothetical protein
VPLETVAKQALAARGILAGHHAREPPPSILLPFEATLAALDGIPARNPRA